MKTKKPEYRVVLEYDGYDPSYDEKLRKAVGLESSGSGFGMGRRDIDWFVPTKAQADKLVKKLRAVRGKRKAVTSYKVEY